MSALQELHGHGQSGWLDDLTRAMLANGELERRVEEGVRGLTSNPSTFHAAIAGGGAYDERIAELGASGASASAIYEALATDDVRDACDVLRPVFESSGGADGFVSLEVSPHLAFDAAASIAEARRLHARVDRPNLLVKIPGTRPGLAAIEELLFEGISVNVTLLFSVERYERVAEAYLRALERRRESGRELGSIASVASFFLSRIDVLVDLLLAQREIPGGERADGIDPRELRGRAGVANAKLAYRRFRGIFDGERFGRLAGRGARVQRMLWASTSTKDPSYDALMYVEPLIGPDTVSTMPARTLDEFLERGKAARTVDAGLEEAQRTMERLAGLDVELEQVTAQLENEGVQKFIDAFDALMELLEQRPRARRERRDA